MFLNTSWIEEDIHKLYEDELEDFEPSLMLNRPEHDLFAERIRKSLYYGSLPSEDRPSLPMTEIAVNYMRGVTLKELGKLDMYLASDIGRRAYISPCSMMLSLIYIERIKHKNPDYLNQMSSSELFLISMMVASKFLYDEGTDEEVYNDEWAEAANMETSEVNALEMHFLRAIDWSLFSDENEFERVLSSMEQLTAFDQGLKRKFWTYGDIMVLFGNLHLWNSLDNMISEVFKVLAVCSVAYVACVCTMAVSIHVATLLSSYSLAVITMSSPHSGIQHHVLLDGLAGKFTDDVLSTISTVPSLLGFDSALDRLSNGVTGYMTNSVNEWNGNESQSGFRENATSGFSVSDFLSVTILKETIYQFVFVLRGSTGKFVPALDLNTTIDDDVKQCYCPKCPSGSNGFSKQSKCLRKFHVIPPMSFWNSLVIPRNSSNSLFCKCINSNDQVRPLDNQEPTLHSFRPRPTFVNSMDQIFHSFDLTQCQDPISTKCAVKVDARTFRVNPGVAVDISPGFRTDQASSRTAVLA